MLQRRKARKKKRKGSSRLGTATKRPWEPLPLQWPQHRRVVGSTGRKRKTARRATRRTARRTASPGLRGLHGPVQRCTESVVAEKIRPQTVIKGGEEKRPKVRRQDGRTLVIRLPKA